MRPKLSYPCYWYRTDANRQWRWSYYAANGEEIAVGSESYPTKTQCRDAITLVQTSGHVMVFEGEARGLRRSSGLDADEADA